MEKSLVLVLLVFASLTVALSGCAPAPDPALVPSTFTPSPTPLPTLTSIAPRPTEEQSMKEEGQRVITIEEITTLTADMGIVEWKLDEEVLGESRTCRTFLGQSWSVSPNYAINCIWKVASGISFKEAIQWLRDSEIIPASSTALESSYDYQGDFALYTYLGPNGHSVYDAFLLIENLLYWASIDLGTPGGYSPESYYDEYSKVIDAFLHDVLTSNLTKYK